MRRPVGAAVAITMVGTLPAFMLSTQAVLIREDLHLSAGRLGVALTTFYVSSALASPVAGGAADRAGPRLSNSIAGALATISLLLLAVNPGSYPLLVLAMMSGGGSNALAQVSSNQLLAGAVPPGRMGLAFGVKQSAVPLATLFGGLAVPVLGATMGWRWSVAAAVLLCLAVSLTAPLAAARSRQATHGGRSRVGRERLVIGPLVVLGIATALASSAMNAHASFLVLWATDRGMGVRAAGLLLAAASVASVATRVWAGVSADGRSGRNLVVVSLQVAAGAIGLLLVSTGTPACLAAGAVLAFALGWSWPGLLMLAVVRAFPAREAAATGMVQTGAFVGGAAGPVFFGMLAQHAGYHAAWLGGVGALLCSSACFAAGRRLLVRMVDRRTALAAEPEPSAG